MDVDTEIVQTTVLASSLDAFNLVVGGEGGGGGGTRLNFETVLGPDSSIVVEVNFEPKFLRIEDFPADANKGFHVVPALGDFFYDGELPRGKNGTGTGLSLSQSLSLSLIDNILFPTDFVRMYSNGALIMAPNPDMSMPFNVITLTCTMIAFLFGTILNILVRKKPRDRGGGKLGKLKERFFGKGKGGVGEE